MTETKNTLTARENEVLALAWQCFGADPKVDMTKLASLTGASARFAFAGIKRKLKAMTAGIDADNPAPLKNKGRHKGALGELVVKKRLAKDVEQDDNDEEKDQKPSKRAKKEIKGLELGGTMFAGDRSKVKYEQEV